MLGMCKMRSASLKRKIDHSIPMTVYPSASALSALGGDIANRVVVHLSDGSIIFATVNGIYKLAGGSSDWSKIYSFTGESIRGVAIAAKGRYVYVITQSSSPDVVKFRKLDSNGNLQGSIVTVCSVYSANRYCNITIGVDGTLHVVFSASDSSSYTSLYIFYAYSLDDGVSWTASNMLTGGSSVCCDIAERNGEVFIFYVYTASATNSVYIKKWNSTYRALDLVQQIIGGSYAVDYVSAVTAPDGSVHLATLRALNNTQFYIDYYVYDGVTWTAHEGLVTSTYQAFTSKPSISADKSSNIYITWGGKSTSSGNMILKQIKYTKAFGTWGAVTDLISDKSIYHAFTCVSDRFDFEIPLCVFVDYTPMSGDISLLKFNGVNGSTVFNDENPSRIWTPHGNAKIDTTQSKFGGSSAHFDGTNSYIDTPDDVNIPIGGTGDFTVDFFFKIEAFTGATQFFCGQADASGSYCSFYIGIDPSKHIYASVYDRNMNINGISSLAFTDTSQFHHLALVKHNSVLQLFIDGTIACATAMTSADVYNASSKLAIGRFGERSVYYYKGWIDRFRISNFARWTTDFTPPTSEDDYVVGYTDRVGFNGVWYE